jgi:hypothetical protein
MIIGTYLACMSAKTKQKVKYEGQLLILNEKINSCRMENTNFLIIGDLNGDLSRNKYYNDVKLREFLKTTKCMQVNNDNRSINFTFHKSENKSRIDHVIID